MHMCEDRRDGADVAGRFSSPNLRVKTFDQKLVDAIIGSKDMYGGPAELSVGLLLTNGWLTTGALTTGAFPRGHRCLLFDRLD
jgi:hypothetical protein